MTATGVRGGKDVHSCRWTRGFGGIISPMSTDTLSATLAAIELPDPDGQDVRLGTLWEAGPAVLVFLRHYG